MQDVFHVRDMSLGCDTDFLRAIAFSSIPRDSDYRQARSWLVARGGLTSDQITIACELHMRDEKLRLWRIEAS